jgi:hypothetical protein
VFLAKHTPARWTRKPDPGTGLDVTHPHCPDHCWPFLSPQGTAKCLTRSTPITLPTTQGDLYGGGSSFVPGRKYGLSVRHGALHDVTRFTADSAIEVMKVVPASGGFTVLICYRKIDSTSRASCAFGGAADGIESDRCSFFPAYIDGNTYWHYGGSTDGVSAVQLLNSGIVFGDDLWICTTGPRGMEVWQNGVLLGSNSGNPTRTNIYAPNMLGLQDFTGFESDLADTALVMTWRRQLSKSAIRELSLNPWQVFEPLPTTLWAIGTPSPSDTEGAGSAAGTSTATAVSQTIRQAVGSAAGTSTSAATSESTDLPSNITIVDVQGYFGFSVGQPFPAFETDPSDGDSIIVAAGILQHSGFPIPESVPTDNYGNTYETLGRVEGLTGNVLYLEVWLAKNIVSGPGLVVTCNVGNRRHGAVAWCVTGVDPDPYNGDFVIRTDPSPGSTYDVGPTTPDPAPNSLFLAFLRTTNRSANDGSGWNTVDENGFTTAMQARARQDGAVSVLSDIFSQYKIESTPQTAAWGGTLDENIAAVFSLKPGASDVTAREGVGSADGTSTATAVGRVVQPSVGTSAGTSTASAVGESATIIPAVGFAAGTSTALAGGDFVSITREEGVGEAEGTSTATADGESVDVAFEEGIGEAFGTSTVEGIGEEVSITFFESIGSASGTSTAFAVGSVPNSHTVTLSPVVTDDGWMGALSYAWTQIAGPIGFPATIVSPTSRETDVVFPSVAGTYTFTLTVSRADDDLIGIGYWRVTVYAAEEIELEENDGPVTILVDGEEIAARINSVRISEGDAETCMFSMTNGSVEVFNEVILERGGARLFGGICMSVTITDDEHVPLFNVSLLGFGWHLTRRRVTKTYTAVPISDIAAELLSMSPGGITADFIAGGLPSVDITFTDQTIDDALTFLGTGINAHHRVDHFKRFHFAIVEIEDVPLPVSVHHPSAKNISVTKSGSAVANRITVYYDKIGAVFTESDIEVSSEEGYDPSGGTTEINGDLIHYSGVRTIAVTQYGSVSISVNVDAVTSPDGQLSTDIGTDFLAAYSYWATLTTPFGETNLIWGQGGSVSLVDGDNALRLTLASITSDWLPSIGNHSDSTISAINIYKGSGPYDAKLIGTISPKGGVLIDTTEYDDLVQFALSTFKYEADGITLVPHPGEDVRTFLTGCSGTRTVPASVTIDDPTAQAALGDLIGGGDNGIIEMSLQGGSLSEADAYTLASTFLGHLRAIENTVSLELIDDNAHPGQTLSINLPFPFDVIDDLKIQQSDVEGFELGVTHKRAITAARKVLTLDGVLATFTKR